MLWPKTERAAMWLLFYLSTLLLQGCLPTNVTESIPTPILTDPHNHVVDVVSATVPPDIAAGFAFVEITVGSQIERYKVVVNPDGTYRAFCIHEVLSGGGFQERLMVEALDTGSTYEIQGLPLPWRPFSDLVWVNNDVLVFDRWAQPHHGTHYAVDARTGELLLAAIFPDQLPTPQSTPQLTPTPTANVPAPTSTPIPTPTPSDLAQYFPLEGWPRYIPPEMWDPPAGRQVVRRGEGPNCKTWLQDDQGNSLAVFTSAGGDGRCPGKIFWSSSKERGVIEFHPWASTPIRFLLIDRDGNRLGDIRKAYWGPVWSPTQDFLSYQVLTDQGERLHIVDGNGVLQVVSEPLSPRQCSACSTPPRWSPDGTHVALIVVLGELGVSEDVLLCLADLDGDVSYISLFDYDLRADDLHWLDNRCLLLENGIWQQQLNAYRYRYFVFDTGSRTIREVWNSADLTPTPSDGP